MKDKQLYKTILENIYDGIYFVDQNRKIIYWNKSAERITGFSASEVINQFCHNDILDHMDDKGNKLCQNGCPLHKTLEDGRIRKANVYLHHKNGQRIPVKIQAIPVLEQEKIIGAIEIFQMTSYDNPILEELEELKVLALQDQLTCLPNRRYIESFLESKIKEFYSFALPFGVAFLDLDRFKKINDIYGHDVGDEILKMVAHSCKRIVRNSDLFGRWGGEEFFGIFSGVDLSSLEKICEKIRLLIENSCLIVGEEKVTVTISIGATLFQSEDTAEIILKRVDTLLYQSKRNGRNQVTMG